MNKTELVAAIAEKAGVKKEDAKKMVDAFIGTVTETLVAEKKVVLVGFGTFEVTKRPARKGRNPLTKETITIKASKQPKFKAGSALKDAVNKKKKK
ncbi:MAG: HU family DNA-binding protein [Lachnospiraceae bacterium]|nr:HU family DNA-binding protein [Lachnospiraceae bacterium]